MGIRNLVAAGLAGLSLVASIAPGLSGVAALGMAAVVLPSSEAQAQAFTRDTPSQQGRDQGQYIPNVALTPDGCEVWVLDDGAEGYASNRLTRQGVPVCRRQNVCGVMNTDQYFATDRYRVSKAGRARLVEFFRASDATAFAIVGHTDSRASDDYNMRLSYNRANAVAAIGREVGSRIVDVRGYGERLPVASNNSAAGMAKNRRVEILCYQ